MKILFEFKIQKAIAEKHLSHVLEFITVRTHLLVID
jgi:hypothetical protein